MLRHLIVSAAAVAAALLQTQFARAGPAPDFSEGSARPTAAELSSHIAGHVFVAKVANGTTWRMDYGSSAGYVFVDLGNGARDTAKWSAEDGRICHQFQRTFPSGCNEYRLVEGQLYLKRNSGEIVKLEAK